MHKLLWLGLILIPLPFLKRQEVPDYQPVADAAVAGAIGAVGVAIVAAAALVLVAVIVSRRAADRGVR